ncbi:MAG: hypothetical protein DSM106950_38500 [Stigonema ocellatum SAG 48.90 = DSM 106950]|nr:hypothetical protein [Stigonema ocellatum SAG 48.90 = DSM 106950]
MANLDNIPAPTLDSEHYRQMLVQDGESRFREWHGEFLRYQREFLKDQHQRIRKIDNQRKSIFVGLSRWGALPTAPEI